MREGIIKFSHTLTEESAPDKNLIQQLEGTRRFLYELKLIGEDNTGLGYGNISIATGKSDGCRQFVISGSQTGGLPELAPWHYTLVKSYDYSRFHVSAAGTTSPSSESLTHAAIYDASDKVQFVIHIHSKKMWDFMLAGGYPATKEAEYGTAEMVAEVKRMFAEGIFDNNHIFAMTGHPAGIISFGKDSSEAIKPVLELLMKMKALGSGKTVT